MFQKVIFDKDAKLSIQQKRLASCINLVADEFIPSTFYLHQDWTIRYALGMPTANFEPDKSRIVYITKHDWDSKNSPDDVPALVPTNEFLFSFNPLTNGASLEQQGLNATTAILCLAAAGVDLILPNVNFKTVNEERISDIKLLLQEERQQYLDFCTQLADDAYDRIKGDEFSDILRWANNEVQFKLVPKARKIEQKISLLNKKTLRDVGLSFWANGIPAIGQSFLTEGFQKGLLTTGDEFVKFIASVLGKDLSERNLPEVSYLPKIARALNDDGSLSRAS